MSDQHNESSRLVNEALFTFNQSPCYIYSSTLPVCELVKAGVVALVSPPDPLIRQSVRMVARQFHIPLIETQWDTDRSNSRFALNVHPAHDAFGKALFQYLSSYSKWNHAVLILADYGSKI